MSEIYTLPDGKRIEYKVYGQEDGYPIVGCHGLLGSVFSDGADELLAGVPIRYILIARPGYGRSDFFLMKNIAEWPEIIKPLLEHLNIDAFDLVGISAGAPYAYATAAAFPDRVKNVFINKGFAAIYKPEILSLYPEVVQKELVVFQKESLANIADLLNKTYLSQLTQEHKLLPYIRDSMVGGCMGMAACGKLEFMDWGFRIEDVEQPVMLYHCRDDQEVPFAMAEKTMEYLKNAELIAHDTGGHMSEKLMMDMMNRIIAVYKV